MSKWKDGESNAKYHGNKKYASRSDLVTTWEQSYIHSLQPKERKAALILGSAIHDKIHATVMGDPKLFDNYYFIKEKDKFKSGEKKASLEANPGKDMLTKIDFNIVTRTAEEILKHPAVKNLLKGSVLERSFYLDDHECPIKARPDCMNIEKGYLVDWKSTSDASPRFFSREIFKYMLDIQAAHYMKVCEGVLYKEFPTFYFVAVEKKEPFGVTVYKLDNETILHSKELHQRLLQNYIAKREQGSGYPLEIQTVTLPQWRLNI